MKLFTGVWFKNENPKGNVVATALDKFPSVPVTQLGQSPGRCYISYDDVELNPEQSKEFLAVLVDNRIGFRYHSHTNELEVWT